MCRGVDGGHQIGANKQYSTLEELWVSDGAGKTGHAKSPTSFCGKQLVLAGLLMDALRSSCEWGVGNPRYFAPKSWPNCTIWIWPATCTSGRIVRARSVFHWAKLQEPSILWFISAGAWLLHYLLAWSLDAHTLPAGPMSLRWSLCRKSTDSSKGRCHCHCESWSPYRYGVHTSAQGGAQAYPEMIVHFQIRWLAANHSWRSLWFLHGWLRQGGETSVQKDLQLG